MSVVKDKRLIGFGIPVANLRQAMESGVPLVFDFNGEELPSGAVLHDVRYEAAYGWICFAYEVEDPGGDGYSPFDPVHFRGVRLEPLVKEDAE